jgi:hypothetical protein
MLGTILGVKKKVVTRNDNVSIAQTHGERDRNVEKTITRQPFPETFEHLDPQ